MANQLSISGSATFQAPAGSTTTQSQANMTLSVVPAGSTYLQTVASITTAETVPNTANVPSIGYVFFRNQDSTNFVQIGSATGAYSINLAAGDVTLAKWNSNAIFAKANTATVALQMFIFSA